MLIIRFLPWLALILASEALAFQYPWYTIPDNIRGAYLMTEEERSAHIYRLQTMKTFDECKTYMQKHYIELEQRARSRNVPLPAIRMDPCEMMRMTGHFR